MLAPWEKYYDKPRQCIKNPRLHFADKGPYSRNYGFASSHVWMWEWDHTEGCVLKNGCFQNVVLETILESPLECKEIKPVNPEGNQTWILIGKTDAEALIIWPPDAKSWLIGKKLWCWQRLRAEGEEDEMVGWHHWLKGQELNKLRETVKDREAWHAAIRRVAKCRTRLSDWKTTTNWRIIADNIRFISAIHQYELAVGATSEPSGKPLEDCNYLFHKSHT